MKETNKEGSEQFYKVVASLLTPYFKIGPKVICFESGQNSKRNYYIGKTLNYVMYDKGLPAIVLCDTNIHKTKYFLSKLPESLRSKVLNNSLLREYLIVTEIGRNMLEELYLSPQNLDIIQLFLVGIRRLTARLIEDLCATIPDLVVILDRTPFTGVLYSKAIKKNLQVDDISPFYVFKPRLHIFIESTKQSFTPSEYQLYDSFEGLNQRITLIADKISQQYPLTIINEGDLNEGLREVLSKVSEVLESNLI